MSHELRRRLKTIDPNLNIIPARGRRRQKPESNSWEKSGGFCCPICGEETLRLVLVEKNKTGCLNCYKKAVEKQTKIETVFAPLLNSKDTGMVRRVRRMLNKTMI